MFRYVAFTWDDTDGHQAATARLLASRLQLAPEPWSSALACPGMEVFCAGIRPGSSEAHRLNGIDGVVLGTVFQRSNASTTLGFSKKTFTASDSQEILASACRTLVTTCWGRYVAFVRDSGTRKIHVLRDPLGGLPCYRTSFQSVQIVFSSIDDLVRLGLMKFTVNPEFIAARIAMVFLNSRETALTEVTAVLAGEQLQIERDRISASLAWNPLEIARHNVIEDPDAAALALRSLAKSCIRSWAACYPALLHKLSGGLDSSIVLACLQDVPARPAITCLNYYSAGCDGDERNFARHAATRAAVALLELERTTDMRLEDMLHINLSTAPTFYLGPLQNSRSEARLAAELGAAAYFNGNGGDQLFYQARGILGAADYLHVHGFNRRFLGVALDIAHLERRSIWHVVCEAYKLTQPWLSGTRGANPTPHRPLVADAAASVAIDANRFTHPLFQSMGSHPPGKFWHAAGLGTPTEFYDPLGQPGDPEPVQPLLSQPLIELCLRIPTYVLMNSGWDRAVARQAFRDDVPREILRRRSKGGLEENVQGILMKNLATARELLLDGHLVKAGLLDRLRLEDVLSDKPTRTSAAMAEIFDHLSVEAWLRRWASEAVF